MKLKLKYIIPVLVLGFSSCDVDNTLPEIPEEAVVENTTALDKNGIDFSKYVSVGASFTAGFTDGALFIKGQENSFPNILSQKFETTFTQPLMNDNIGGFVSGETVVQEPRFYFNGEGPVRLEQTPTTVLGAPAEGSSFNNYGIPGAKSFHLVADNYGNSDGLITNPITANPYFARMNPVNSSVISKAVMEAPTFFTLSEVGGNDVLGYALSGGYDESDITNPSVFTDVYNVIVNALTANGAKGVVANIPYITSLAHFTTVPYNAVPLDADKAAALNQAFQAYNGGLAMAQQGGAITADEVAKRTINFVEGQNAVLIVDENLTNLSGLGNFRQATAEDLLVLPAASFIGTLAGDGSDPNSINGVSVPLADQWVLTPEEQQYIKNATDAYNTTIKTVADAKGLAFVDFKSILEQASTNGIVFDEFRLTTDLVTGGLISLDGVHLTARGYALMANEFLKAIDAKYGSNFAEAKDGLAKAIDYPVVYPASL